MSDLSPEEKFALTPEEEEFWSGERGLKQNLGQEAYKILSDYLSPKDKKSMLSSADVQPHGWRDQDPRIKRAHMYLNAARKKKEENAAKEKKAAEDKLIAMPKSAAYTEALAEAVRIIKDAYENAKQKEVIVNNSKPQQQKKKNHKFKEQRDMWVYTDDYYENAEIQTHASQNNVISRSGEFFKFLFF